MRERFSPNKRPTEFHFMAVVAAVAPPANCDAAALQDKAMDQVALGQHAVALVHFEASLRCKKDMYVLQLAFMEACNAGNSAKAKQYYKLLTPPQQNKFRQICSRQHPPVAYE